MKVLKVHRVKFYISEILFKFETGWLLDEDLLQDLIEDWCRSDLEIFEEELEPPVRVPRLLDGDPVQETPSDKGSDSD
ncbi:unnamed protein product [Parnassius mnemosyne]|uniref:Uncharacterized protein n=1 Tax=Parnassius mnemosyne TaxID=213953 RepID=A0AAV1LZ51_9NEOP